MIYANTYSPINAGGPWATPGLTITGGDEGFEALVDLNNPLPGIDHNPLTRVPRPKLPLLGTYTLTWDLTGFTLPPVTSVSGWFVRVHLYVAGAGMRPYAIDPCASDAELDSARVVKVGRPPLITATGDGSEHQMVVSEPISVISIRGEVRCFSEVSHRYEYDTDPASVLLWREVRDGYELLE